MTDYPSCFAGFAVRARSRFLTLCVLLALAGCQGPADSGPADMLLNRPVLESVTALRTIPKVGNIESIALSPDGRLVAVGGGGLRVRVVALATGDVVFEQELGAYPIVTSVDFSPDGRYVMAAGGGGVFRVWDTAQFKVVQNRAGFKAKSAVFMPDGRHMAVASSDGMLMLWQLDPLLLDHRKRVDPILLHEVAVSSDGRRALTGGSDGAGLWDLATYELLHRFQHTEETVYAGVWPVKVNPVYCVAFSPDGHRALTGGEDGTMRLWDCASGQELLLLRAHAESVRDVGFSPDGRLAITCGIDVPGPDRTNRQRMGVSSMRVWELKTARCVACVQMPTFHALRAAMFMDGGGRVLTGGVGRRYGGLREWGVNYRLGTIRREWKPPDRARDAR